MKAQKKKIGRGHIKNNIFDNRSYLSNQINNYLYSVKSTQNELGPSKDSLFTRYPRFIKIFLLQQLFHQAFYFSILSPKAHFQPNEILF